MRATHQTEPASAQQLAGLLAHLLGFVQVAAQEMEVGPGAERLGPGDDAAALLGELARPVEQGLHAVELEPDAVDAGQLVRGHALRVLVLSLARRLERLLPVLLRVLQVGEPPGDVGEHGERLVAGSGVLVLERHECLLGQVLGPEHVRVS